MGAQGAYLDASMTVNIKQKIDLGAVSRHKYTRLPRRKQDASLLLPHTPHGSLDRPLREADNAFRKEDGFRHDKWPQTYRRQEEIVDTAS